MGFARPIREWRVGQRRLELGHRTWVMAIVNLTPDSFYPASRVTGLAALAHAAGEALAAGADILDLGAESTRPGAEPVPSAEEQERLLPGLAAVRRQFPQALLSADTRHPDTARRALDAGADIINDVTGLEAPEMAALVAASGCGAVLMHHRGAFASMHRLPPLADPLGTVLAELRAARDRALAAGVRAEQLMLDPGFGFGKHLDENFPLLAGLEAFAALDAPLLVGLSRKSFLRAAPTGAPEHRLAASLAAATAAALAGAHCVRVHDVAETVAAMRVADRVLRMRVTGARGPESVEV